MLYPAFQTRIKPVRTNGRKPAAAPMAPSMVHRVHDGLHFGQVLILRNRKFAISFFTNLVVPWLQSQTLRSFGSFVFFSIVFSMFQPQRGAMR
jgi:hypothetical protein